MRAPTLVLLALLAGCVTVPPDAEPLPGDLEPAEEPEVLDCVDVYPAVDGETSGPAAVSVVNRCSGVVACDVLGGGWAWSGELKGDGGWWSTPYDVCGTFRGSCESGDSIIEWEWDIACTS